MPNAGDDLNRLGASFWSAYQTSFREEHERLKMPRPQGRKVAESTLVNLFGDQSAKITITDDGLEF